MKDNEEVVRVSQTALQIILIMILAVFLTAIGLAIWNSVSNTNAVNSQNNKINNLTAQQEMDFTTPSEQITILNTTMFVQFDEVNVKIMLVNTTLWNEIIHIYSILNVSYGNATGFEEYVNNSLIVINGQISDLQMNISTINGNIISLQGNITEIYNNLTQVWSRLIDLENTKLNSINNVSGDPINKNVNLVSVNNNLEIVTDPSNHTIYFNKYSLFC